MQALETGKGQPVELGSHAMSVYKQEEVAKFLATASSSGDPNVALIVSQTPVEPGRIIFGEFMMVKTKRNLEENPRVASFAISEKLKMAGFKAEVRQWVGTGPYIEKLNNIEFFRYNAYAGIHRAAVCEITSPISLPQTVSYSSFAVNYAMIHASAFHEANNDPRIEIPAPVKKKFNGLMVIKALAYVDDDGFPGVLPILATAVHGGVLRFKVANYNRRLKELELPARVAVNVLTMDLMSYQVKGDLDRFERRLGVDTGVVIVKEVYSSMPPLCGERLV